MAPLPIEGVYGGILSVRDLGSKKGLEALGVEREDGEAVAASLQGLFLRHGAPLVLKTDVGSPFNCKRVDEVLAHWRVAHMVSPTVTPAYNGSIEAGIGGIKTRAHHIAAAEGGASLWTCDDLEAARRLGNGNDAYGPSADERWEQRKKVDEEDRRRFEEALSSARTRVQSKKPHPETRADRRTLQRQAITLALQEDGHLQLTRRRISPPVSTRIAARIS